MKIILLAIRSLMRFRLYTVINVLGLALSLACVIIISRYVYSEATTDHFNKNHERIYLSARYWPDGNQEPLLFTTSNVLSKRNYKDPLELPEIEKKSSFVSLYDVNVEANNSKFSSHVLAADTLFLEIFSYSMIEGEPTRALSEPNSTIITSSFAHKLFGNESPIGKNIQYNEHLLTVQGVIGEPKTQSSLSFDMLISQKLQWRWPPVNYYSVALLVEGTDVKKVNQKLEDYCLQPNNETFLFQLFPLDQLYMDNTIRKGENTFRQGNRNSLHILSTVALLLLTIGILNFIHICSSIILKRGQELGMKKVFGATPRQIFIQLYAENLTLVGIALLLGWTIIEITYPLQINILQITSTTPQIFNLALSFGLLFGLPLIITLYPFFHYNKQHTVISLQGIISGKNKQGMRFLFLILQYSITICLIVSALFFTRQLHFMLEADLGYRTKDIIKVWFERPSSTMYISEEDTERTRKYNERIQAAIKASPIFQSYCFGISPYEFPLSKFNLTKARVPGGEWQDILYIKVQRSFFTLYEIPINGTIPTSENEVLLNATAQKAFAGKDQQTPLIEVMIYDKITPCQIKGYTSDIQTVHLSRNNMPVVLVPIISDNFFGKCMASINPGHRIEAIRFFKELHDELIGGEFEYSFVDDEIEALYNNDKQIATIYSVFALIAILISSLGLFGLSLFDIQQRYKEIAIRKVNGATVGVITNLLLRKYYRLLGLSFIIATPLSWLAITKYMENFANKAPLSWWIFAVAFLLTTSISLITLIWQIRKAARTNPAKAIKTE